MKKIFLRVLMLLVILFLSVSNFDSFASELPSQEANLVVQPLRELSTLESITFMETTTSINSWTYSKNSNQLCTRLNTLTSKSLDFMGTNTEYYDVFYSDANGNLDINGGYITIEGVYGYQSWGFNIAEVKLNFTGSKFEYANTVSSYRCCGKTADSDSVKNAIDSDINTYTNLGHTVGSNERMRLTLGFASNVQKPITKDFSLLKADAGDSKVDLQWSKAENTTSYNVKRATTASGKYGTIATTSNTSYTDKTAVNGTTYYYVVSAVNRGGESENSNEVSAKPIGIAD